MTPYRVSPPDVQFGVDARWGIPYALDPSYHRWPIHVVGLSGGGKSTLLGNGAEQFAAAGEGCLVLDIKDGQLAQQVAARTAFPERLVYVSPGQCYFNGDQRFWGFNPLEFDRTDANQRDSVVAAMMEVFTRLGTSQQEFTQVKLYLNMALYLALSADRPTLITVETILQSQRYRRGLYTDPKRRKMVPANILKEWERFDSLQGSKTYDKVGSTIPRVMSFLIPDALRYMLGQDESTLTIGKWLNDGKLVVIDCASGMPGKSDLHASTSVALGNLILASVITEAMTRPDPEKHDSTYWRLVCDEMDQLAGDSFVDLIDKARTRRTLPVMAHQSRDQLQNEPGKKKLHSAMGRCRVQIELPQGDYDLYERSRVISEAEVEALRNLQQFTARLTLITGLTGNREHETIALENWRRPVVEGQLEAAIADQQPNTRSGSELKRVFAHEYDRWSVAYTPYAITATGHEMMDPEDEQPRPTPKRAKHNQSQRRDQQPDVLEVEATPQAAPIPETGQLLDADFPDRSSVPDVADAGPVPDSGRRSRRRTPFPRADQ